MSYIIATTSSGAILVFLTGWEDITAMQKRLERRFSPMEAAIFPLHSEVPSQVSLFSSPFLFFKVCIYLMVFTKQGQQDVFMPMKDRRKVVLATNIAESSITIDDVVYVVDCGKAKEKSYFASSRVSILESKVYSFFISFIHFKIYIEKHSHHSLFPKNPLTPLLPPNSGLAKPQQPKEKVELDVSNLVSATISTPPSTKTECDLTLLQKCKELG